MANPARSSACSQAHQSPTFSDYEDLEGYALGGYCPVDIGKEFTSESGTYTVLHKLGFGPSSTVWLVKQECEGHPTPALRALKIFRADLSNDNNELEMMRLLEQADRASKPHPNLMQIEVHFTVPSANGVHLCLVLPLLGPSLEDPRVLDSLGGGTRIEICKQVAHAVNRVHAFDVSHGNLSPRHILFKLPRDFVLDIHNYTDVLGPIIVSRPLRPSHHRPRRLIKPARFPGLDPPSLQDVVLIGFTKAFIDLPGNPRPLKPHCPLELFPPEVLFGFPPSRKSDIWQLACLMFKIHTGYFPFGAPHCCHVCLVTGMVRYLGPIPEGWEDTFRWNGYGRCQRGSRHRDDVLAEWCDDFQLPFELGDIIDIQPHLDGSEGDMLKKLLQEMLIWDPDKRLSMGGVEGQVMGMRTYVDGQEGKTWGNT